MELIPFKRAIKTQIAPPRALKKPERGSGEKLDMELRLRLLL